VNSDFADLFLDLASDTVTIVPGTFNSEGAFVASGSTISAPCHIEGSARLVRDVEGREVVSNLQVYVLGVYDLTVHQHRYTLPTRFSPRVELQAVAIEKSSDEVGPVYETVMLP
jgi:hypothetical protein